MNKTKIAYACHPYTTYGLESNNKQRARLVQKELLKNNYAVINPLEIVPCGLNWKDAMEVCMRLLEKSDILIICSDDWIHSEGCIAEVKWAIDNNKPIYRFVAVVNQAYKLENFDIEKFKKYIENRDKMTMSYK